MNHAVRVHHRQNMDLEVIQKEVGQFGRLTKLAHDAFDDERADSLTGMLSADHNDDFLSLRVRFGQPNQRQNVVGYGVANSLDLQFAK